MALDSGCRRYPRLCLCCKEMQMEESIQHLVHSKQRGMSLTVLDVSNQLTPWSRVLREKLTVAHPFNSPTFYVTRRFINVFKRARHWSLSWIRFIPPALFLLRPILIISHIHLGLGSCLLLVFFHQNLYACLCRVSPISSSLAWSCWLYEAYLSRSTSYGASHYAFFSSLVLSHPAWVQISCSKTSTVYLCSSLHIRDQVFTPSDIFTINQRKFTCTLSWSGWLITIVALWHAKLYILIIMVSLLVGVLRR